MESLTRAEAPSSSQDVPSPEGTAHADSLDRSAFPLRPWSAVQRLADNGALIWWSYPAVHGRDADGVAQQVIDLLVVLGGDILLVSEQPAPFEHTGDLTADWSRWYTRTVQAGVTRLTDAERWLRTAPDSLFLDAGCTVSLTAVLPEMATAHVHHLIVADGASERALRHHRNVGAVGINSRIHGQAHTGEGCTPFMLGRVTGADTDPWVHVLDAFGLDTVLRVMDTIPDLRTYLHARAQVLSGATHVFASGEEEVVARYVTDGGQTTGMFDITRGLARRSAADAVVVLAGGGWHALVTSPAWAEYQDATHLSSIWDFLIDVTVDDEYDAEDDADVLEGVYAGPAGHVVRCLASESRALRIALTQSLDDVRQRGLREPISVRMALPGRGERRPFYVLMTLQRHAGDDIDAYDEARERALMEYCKVVRFLHPTAQDVVGIATEPGLTDLAGGTFHLVHVDGRTWTAEQQEEARRLHEEGGLFANQTMVPPTDGAAVPGVGGPGMKGYARNLPCPCGSGRKFKHCHGRAGR